MNKIQELAARIVHDKYGTFEKDGLYDELEKNIRHTQKNLNDPEAEELWDAIKKELEK